MKKYETIAMSAKDSLVIRFLYNSLPGRVLLNLLVRPCVSRFFGFLMDSPVSVILIRDFIRNNNIKMNDYEKVEFKSFNDFFTRQIKKTKRPFPSDKNQLAAPCDGKLTVYPIEEDSIYKIKNSAYDLVSLLGNKKLAQEFAGGVCLIFRLMPDDYHRYAFIDDGEIAGHKKIRGILHTVRPIALKRYRIYAKNAREYTIIKTNNFGKAVQMEVGALFVGRIKNHLTSGMVERGEEKGMFEFGGSTVVVLLKKDAVMIDSVIYMNTLRDKETVVKMGQVIGRREILSF